MTLAIGLGDVTSNKNILLSAQSCEKLCAVIQANNFDFWVIAHKLGSDTFLVYSITSAGVNTSPVTSKAGSNDNYGLGYLKASVNGSKLANANYANFIDLNVDVLDFNNLSGKVSDNFSIPFSSPFLPYGVEFSPNGNLLYITGGPIFQFDLTLGTTAAIISSSTLIGDINSTDHYALQMGPDKKIYIARYLTSELACIGNPNALGLACGFNDNAINLSGKRCDLGLPNFISSYFKSCYNFNIKVSDVTINAGETAQLTAKGANSYVWSAEIISTGTNTAKVTPSVTTSYTVTGTNGNNCSDTDTFKVVVNSLTNCEDIFIPNAFSPNNDGNNDTFFVRQNTTCVKNFDLTIFDRWGNKVFETNDIAKGWDGRENFLGLLRETSKEEGEYLNTEIYFYLVNIILSNNATPIVKKGNVSLIR